MSTLTLIPTPFTEQPGVKVNVEFTLYKEAGAKSATVVTTSLSLASPTVRIPASWVHKSVFVSGLGDNNNQMACLSARKGDFSKCFTELFLTATNPSESGCPLLSIRETLEKS